MSGLEPVAPTTDGGNQGSAGVAATASAGPYTPDEFRALFESVWSCSPDSPQDDGDLTMFNDLLHAALVFVGQVALRPEWWDWHEQAAALLRSMEQRGLGGPDHPARQP